MEKHLSYPGHPKFEPKKWNNNKYIKHSHNCYSYALNVINKKNANRCKRYTLMQNKHKKKYTKKRNALKKKCMKKFSSWEWCDYNKKDKCDYLRIQPGLHGKTIKKFNKKKTSVNIRSLTKMLLKDNPTIKKLRKGSPCPMGYYRIYLFPTYNVKYNGGDYHFLRQDNTGEWSEKWSAYSAVKVKYKTPEEYLKYLNKIFPRGSVFKGRYFAVPIKGKKNMKNLMDKY